MSDPPTWWRKPRDVFVAVDNPSWILPHAETLVNALNAEGDSAVLCRAYHEVGQGVVAFYLGCVGIAPPEVLRRNRRNLVVHESDLPAGRGFAPLTWQILEGRNSVPICLLEAAEDADGGPVVYRETLEFEGHELVGELRRIQGEATVELCRRFMGEAVPPVGEPQVGQPSYYRRRRPEDSRLDPGRTLAEQFDLMRVADNERYPAFFEYRGHRYVLTISKETAQRRGLQAAESPPGRTRSRES